MHIEAENRAILFPPMKLLLGLLFVVLIALSIFADYKWRRWMAVRKLERESGQDHDPTLRS